MIEKFIEMQFKPQSLELIRHTNEIVSAYTKKGFGLSLRQLFYQFVHRKVLKNTPQNYDNLGALMTNARKAGLVDWDALQDRNRVTEKLATYDTITECLQKVADGYRLDKWKKQAHYVEVMVEKQALEGVLLPICQRWYVPFTANKGYSSVSALYERGKYIQSMRDVERKKVHVIYLGDHDPSGIQMSEDLQSRLEMFSDGPVDVRRIALNIDQVRSLRLDPDPAKLADSRAAAYIERFGPESWELDAIEPTDLANLLEQEILTFINEAQWDKDDTLEEQAQLKLQNIIEKLKA